MTILNQQHQAQVDGIIPMPTDRVDDTSVVNTSTSETVVWYYNNSGAWGTAATQAAGTVCAAKLTYTGVLNALASAIGNKNDTSLSFGAATRAATLVEVPEEAFSKMESMSVADKMTHIATWLDTNGEYAIDHRRGQVWMKSLATVANDAATYKYPTTVTGGGTGDKVDLIKIGGVAVVMDDGAFTAGTSGGMVAFGFADETTPDSVSEGDAGALRMTLDRKLHISSNFKEDTAHADGAYGTHILGVRNDALAALAGTDGDYASHQLDANGALYVQLGSAADNSPIATDDSAQDATPEIINVGGEYRASDTTYTDGDATILQTDVNGYTKIRSKAYDEGTQADKVGEVNPLSEHHQEVTLADVTDETSATNYYYVDMDGFRYFSFQLETSGAAPGDTLTVTVEATNQDDGTAQANCTYQDVTNALFGVASWVDTDAYAIADTPTAFKYVRIKTVTAGGNNDADYTIYFKKMW